MVSVFPMQSYYKSMPLSVDTRTGHKYMEEDDANILDDNILESGLDSGLEMSPPMADSRRDSFAVGAPLFSPKTEDWQSVDMQSIPSSGGYAEQHSTNPFMRLDPSQTPAFSTQGGAWSMSNGSGACTPLQQFDGMHGEFDNTSIFQRPPHSQAPFNGGGNIFSGLHSDSSLPTSPQKEWIGQSHKKSPDGADIRSHNEMRRGDGIRKKNARFDIPAERNLSNIDQLIAQSTDEQEIKELKQQKRLLRNRQAALDSRQRKKQHTERLEDEKKQYTALVQEMEEELVVVKGRMEQLMREKQSYTEYIETMNMEKEEMIRRHTVETGELRKKVGVLTSHVQRLEAMNSGVQGYHGFEMDSMPMNGWDHVGFLNEYQVEPEIKQEQQMASQMSIVKKNEVAFPADAEKSNTQGGLLFMLFLVGAFVLSSRSTPSIPPVSEDVRAASATLLENVLKDAGVGPATGMEAIAPQPSGTWSNVPGMQMGDAHVPNSMLGELADTLTQPTQEQANEQLFSLSAAQYNGVNSQDFMQNNPERSTSQGRRNLADALAAMRNTKPSAADVYTRSLLWDQIPSEVVRNFAKMFQECNRAQNEQQCATAGS